MYLILINLNQTATWWLARDYSIGQQSSKAAQTWTTNSFSPSCEGVWGGGPLTPLNFQTRPSVGAKICTIPVEEKLKETLPPCQETASPAAAPEESTSQRGWGDQLEAQNGSAVAFWSIEKATVCTFTSVFYDSVSNSLHEKFNSVSNSEVLS